jgi:UDP-2,3-diacylglucosamine pyrophosphatase LpxH
MGKTVVISDCHIGSLESNYRSVNKFLHGLECDRLILAGDFWDLWDSTPDMLRERYGDTVLLLGRLVSNGTRVDMMIGNHELGYLDNPIMPLDNLPIIETCEVETSTGRRIAIAHGHDFDPLYSKLYVLSRSLAWANRMSRRVLGISYKTFKSDRVDMSGKQAFLLAQKTHKNATEAYVGHGYDGLVMGHSHSPCHVRTDRFEFVNAGDWKYHDTYVEIEDDDVRLLQFKP